MTSTPLWQQNHLIFDINDKLEIFRQHLSNIHKEPEGPHFDQTHYNTVKNYILTNRLTFTPLNTPTPPLHAHPTTDPITIEDIHNALHRKRSTAPGQDKITYHLLKKLPNTAIHFLSNLYTASLYLGYVPKRWKHAHILLFPKPDKDQTNPNNYRPISLTCTISKLLEKIIVNRIHKHLSHIIIPNSQAGFRPGLNTKHQLMRVITPIEHAFYKRFTPVLVALDIQKAFDTVWHDGIRYKLSRMPIPNTITRWISNFLSDRTGQIKLDNTLSHTFNIRSVIPTR